jgi:hypothetical protein
VLDQLLRQMLHQMPHQMLLPVVAGSEFLDLNCPEGSPFPSLNRTPGLQVQVRELDGPQIYDAMTFIKSGVWLVSFLPRKYLQKFYFSRLSTQGKVCCWLSKCAVI